MRVNTPSHQPVSEVEHSDQATSTQHLSQEAFQLDAQIGDLLHQHIPNVPGGRGQELIPEIKNKLISTLWFVSHFNSTPWEARPVPSSEHEVMWSLRGGKILGRILGALGRGNTIDQMDSLLDRLCQIEGRANVNVHALELLAKARNEMLPAEKLPRFDQLPSLAKQAVIDQVVLSGSLHDLSLLQGLRIHAKGLHSLDLKGVNLKGAELRGAFANNLSGACLDNANLTEFEPLDKCVVSGASFVAAKFGFNTCVTHRRFHACDLSQIHIDFSHEGLDADDADGVLNHLHNETSFLSDLRDWPINTPAGAATRCFLMQRLAEGLAYRDDGNEYSPVNDRAIAVAIADMVCRDPIFSADQHPAMSELRSKVTQTLLRDTSSWVNQLFFPGSHLDSPTVVQTCTQSAIDLMSPAQGASTAVRLMAGEDLLSYSRRRRSLERLPDSGLNHLLAAGVRHTQTTNSDADRSPQQMVALTSTLRESQWRRLPSALVELLESQGVNATLSDFYIERNDEKSACMVFHQQYFDSSLNIMSNKNAVPGFDWKNAYLFRVQEPSQWTGPFGVGELSSDEDPTGQDLGQFSLGACYLQADVQRHRSQIKQLFELTVPTDDVKSSEFATLFSALRLRPSHPDQAERLKWLSPEKSNELADIFGACLTRKPQFPDASPLTPGGMALNPAHVHALNTCLVPLCGSHPSERARWFFALGTTYTQLSSSGLMGTELDSPMAVRTYAAALLSHAHDLDSDVFNSESGEDNFRAWHAQLCGEGRAFTCTSLLSNQLRAQVSVRPHDEALQRAFASIYPVNWR